MSISIIKQGMLTSLQDLGRPGYRAAGIGTGGAMDHFAASVSNYLAGNDESKPVIEINFPAPEILFNVDALCSIAGADFLTVVNDVPVQNWCSFFVKKGSVVKFKKPVTGSKAYLAIAGGFQADSWLGSCSTQLQVQAGGLAGRVLQKGDEVLFQNHGMLIGKKTGWNISQFQLDKIYQPAKIIRCIKSVEWELMDAVSKNKFSQQKFIISIQSNRMGYRLKGSNICLSNSTELISSPVDAGTIQLLPDGNLIVLLADHQTTGGYPRIASVIKADLPKFSQLMPGQEINFILTDIEHAEDALISMNKLLNDIKNSCLFNFKNHFNLD